jgi:aldehyde dehydrogenase (NAD+)
MATPEHIAAVIYGAATDGTNRLRYFAGDDVKHLVEARRKLSDEEYENHMRAQSLELGFESPRRGEIIMNAITKTDAIKTLTTHYIDGAFVESHGREVMDVIKPTDGKVIGRVTLADEEDTRRAIAAAKRAFVTYGRSTKEERAAILRRLHAAVSARIDDLIAAMVEEYGGVVQFAGPIVQSGVGAFLAAERALQEMPWTRNWRNTTVTFEPVGVAGLITAWNANALFICLKLASAVAAGCTVIIKPSELSSLQTRVLVEALHEATLPKGLLNVLTGRGEIVGAELVRNLDVNKISFTGSVAVGQGIMRDGAATMKRVTLELGGKSPTILLDDADLDKAVPAALVMAFLNSGQACAAGTRLLVPKSRLDDVKQAILKTMLSFPVGDPADRQTAIGPMVSQKQYDRVQSYIRKGIEEGAEVLVGGEGHPQGLEAGFFVKPTVFVNVKNDMTIAREEIFGPVLSVISYDSEDEAISIANDSKYGLHAAVVGTDIGRSRRVASNLRAGRVVINGMTDDPQAPWGGFKYSGVGREYGRYGIEAFLETRAILEA